MKFFGEDLIIKMWDSLIDRGVGGLLAPWQAKRMGSAEAEIRSYEKLRMAETEYQINAARKRSSSIYEPSQKLIESLHSNGLSRCEYDTDINIDLEAVIASVERADLLEKTQEKINISRAVMIAEKELLFDDSDVPRENIDSAWLRKWQNSAKYVSTENLQTMWGKILAGESKNPGAYSVRVLDLLNSLSEKEADKISLVAKYIIQNNIHIDKLDYLGTKGISLGLLLELQSIGILVGVDSGSLGVTYDSQSNSEYQRFLRCNNKALIVKHKDINMKLSFQTISVTGVGKKLIDLGSFEVDLDYLQIISRELVDKGYEVSTGDCEKRGDQLSISNIVEIEA